MDDADDKGRLDAVEYWGYHLFQPNKCPTEKLDRLLRGIAASITKQIEPNDNHNDLTPTQLATFYQTVGANYDGLFLDKPPHVVAFIYKSLGCLHSLQPSAAPDEIDSSNAPDPYSSPSVPALKPRGFVTWQTIQLLLGPAEHVPVIQNALLQFDVLDPFTGQPFPKNLPEECFPDKPDDSMIAWHDGVGERLRIEAQGPAKSVGGPPGRSERPPASSVPQTPQDERNDVATYFSSAHRRPERPSAARTLSSRAKQTGKAIAMTVKQTASPYLWGNGAEPHTHNHPSSSAQSRPQRRRSDGHPHAHFEDEDDDDRSASDGNQRSRTSRTMPPPRLRHKTPVSMPPHRASGPPPRRHSQTRHATPQLSPTDSDDSLRRSASPRRRPRRPRSHEIGPSPREEFGYYDRTSRPQYSSDRPVTAGAQSSRRRVSPRSRRHSDSRRSGSSRADVPERPASSYFPADYAPAPGYKQRAPANSSRPRSEMPSYRPGPGSGAQGPPPPGSPYLSPRGSGSRLRHEQTASGSHVSGASSGSPGFRDPMLSPGDEYAPTPPRRSSYGNVSAGPGSAPLSAGGMSNLTSPGGVPLVQSPPPSGTGPLGSPPGAFDRDARSELSDAPEGSAMRPRERERFERPGLARHVTPVDGVGGRRYPSEALWR